MYNFPLPAVWPFTVYPSTTSNTSSMDVHEVSLSANISMDVQGVSISTANRMAVQVVTISRARSMDVQCAGCMSFHCQKYERAGCTPFLKAGISDCTASSQSDTGMNKKRLMPKPVRYRNEGTSPVPECSGNGLRYIIQDAEMPKPAASTSFPMPSKVFH